MEEDALYSSKGISTPKIHGFCRNYWLCASNRSLVRLPVLHWSLSQPEGQCLHLLASLLTGLMTFSSPTSALQCTGPLPDSFVLRNEARFFREIEIV